MYFCCKRKHSFGVFNRFLKKRRKNVNGNDHRRNSNSNVASRFSQQQESQSLNFDHVEAHMSVDLDDEAESAWNTADTKLYWQVAFRMYSSYFITSFIDIPRDTIRPNLCTRLDTFETSSIQRKQLLFPCYECALPLIVVVLLLNGGAIIYSYLAVQVCT